MKVCIVRWVDACETTESSYADEISLGDVQDSIGWFVKETKDFLVISRDYHVSDGRWYGALSIPKKWILKRKDRKIG